MKKFNILAQQILHGDEYLELRSFEEFRHFCGKLGLIAELETDYLEQQKYIQASLYFMKQFENKKPVKFDYYNQDTTTYNKELYDKLSDYKKHYRVTLDGTKDSPEIIWG